MRISLPKNYLIRLSKVLYDEKILDMDNMKLYPEEVAYTENKFSVSIESQVPFIVKQIHNSVSGIHVIVLHLMIVYNYEVSVSRRETEIHKDRQAFYIFVFSGDDTTQNVACDMDVQQVFPYGKSDSPSIHPNSYLARLVGVDETKNLLSRHVGIHEGFELQIQKVRNQIKSIIYGGSKTSCQYCDFVFTGHGIGGALALISAMESVATAELDCNCDAAFSVISFGAPKPGNYLVKKIIDAAGIKVKRFVITNDRMSSIPPKSGRVRSEQYVHPCSKRRLGSLFAFACIAGARENKNIGTYFKIFADSIGIVKNIVDLADAVESIT